MEGFPTFNVSWPWPWIGPGSYCIPSCIAHRPLPTRQISVKSKKLCRRTDGLTLRTYVRTDGGTDGHFRATHFIKSTQKSWPNEKLSYRRETRATLCISWTIDLLLYEWRKQMSMRSTFSNCHVLFRYLHSFVHASLH